ncbi:MAG TPA: hypothetical protein VKV25_05305, partial [Acidimicrobiales bacterium]|nr:hypothetical protein [Acidimicrobiales bacterium]
MHSVAANLTDGTGERSLLDGVETVTIDDRRSIQPHLDMVDVDLCSEAPDRSGDLGNGYEATRVEHLGSGEQQDRSPL